MAIVPHLRTAHLASVMVRTRLNSEEMSTCTTVAYGPICAKIGFLGGYGAVSAGGNGLIELSHRLWVMHKNLCIVSGREGKG